MDKSKAMDSINSPSHYNQGSIEVIDYIEDRKNRNVEGENKL